MFPNFFCHLFYILNTFMCLLLRFLTKEIERMEVPVLISIVQCEFEGLEHFDQVHGLQQFELREKLSLSLI